MALTEQQKAENKAAQRVRDRAHQSRYRQLREALEASEVSPEVLRTRKIFDALDTQFSEAVENRMATERALRVRVAELEEQIKALKQDPELERLKARRSAAADTWQRTKSCATREAESKFPDMEGNARYSAVGWQPPTEVITEMEVARRVATPESVNSKKTKPKD